MEPHERLKMLRKEYLELTQSEIASVLGITPSSYSLIESGKRRMKDSYIKILSRIYDINEDWIYTGRGEKFLFSQDRSEMLWIFEQLKPETKQFLIREGKSLLQLQQEMSPVADDTKKET